MEFIKNKKCSLWIIAIILVSVQMDMNQGLQSEPTWIFLGVKSPFIEFNNEIEVLANTSISLNITKDEQALMHREGLKKVDTLIKPIDLRDSKTGFVRANFTKKIDNSSRRRTNPIQEEMDQKQIILLDEDTDENGLPVSLTDEDRRFIVPLALKNINPDSKYSPTTPQTTTTTTMRTAMTKLANNKLIMTPPQFAANIDDLKNHILFLQNLTKHDSNFQSKFVVFPSLQKDKQSLRTTPMSRQFLRYTTLPTLTKVSRQKTNEKQENSEKERSFIEKIIIAPQVLLLNDQTPLDNVSSGNDQKSIYSKGKINFQKNVNLNTTEDISTVPKITQQASGMTTNKVSLKRSRNNSNKNQRNLCLRNPESLKCQRQRRRQEIQWQREHEDLLKKHDYQPFLQTINNTKRFAVSIEIPDSFKTQQKQTSLKPFTLPAPAAQHVSQELSRTGRSHHKRRNIGSIGSSTDHENESSTSRDFLLLNHFNAEVTNNSKVDSEVINLNPELCSEVNGLTQGQKKLCVLHTSVMPAISRGARAAIQECQTQFKNRRWNCSITDDSSVFGPMTTLGSPEIAFIHALAAATVTSFIARACRDGQLASCGCSRGARPKQLHDDWTWGGCGDDLEYAYKFSQDFVDIREKERKRETRGVQRQRNLMYQDGKFKAREMLADTVPAATFGKKNATTTETNVASLFGTNITNNQYDQNNSISNKNVNKTGNEKRTELTQGGNISNRTSTTTQIWTRPQDAEFIGKFKSEDLLDLQERIAKEILNSKLQEKEMIELQEKINREILNSKVFNMESLPIRRRKNQRAVSGSAGLMTNNPNLEGDNNAFKWKNSVSAKARCLMNLHNNEAGRRAVIKKSRITCKCHGVSGSCSLITCWQQLSSIREIGDFLREKYEEATEVKLNKRGRLQVKDPLYKIPTAHDLVYLDDSPDWCRSNRQLRWPGTHGRICNKSSTSLDGCNILCCGRGYNTKSIVVRERCNCKFHWCCQVKCEVCLKIIEEHTCK